MAFDHALRPSKTHLMKTETGVLRADVVENSSDCPPHPGIEAFN